MANNNFIGTINLLRFYLRRDRFVMPVWVLLPVLLIAGQISFIESMPDWQKFMKEISASPLTNAMLGPIFPLSKEGAVLWRGMLQGAIAGSSIILLVLGISVGLGWGYSTGDMSLVYKTIVMGLSKIPSAWVIIGIVALLYGWLPRVSAVLSWIFLGLIIGIEMLWEAGIVGWSAMELTPFGYAHYSIPINELSALSISMLIILSLIFLFVGFIGLKRRSINS